MDDVARIENVRVRAVAFPGAFVGLLTPFEEQPKFSNLFHTSGELPVHLYGIPQRDRVRFDAQLRPRTKQAEKRVDRHPNNPDADETKWNQENRQKPLRATLAAHPHLDIKPDEN